MSMYFTNKTPSLIQQQLASRFKSVRKKAKLSQQETANRSGVSLGSLKRFEASGQISLESILKLAHLFNRLEDFDEVFQEIKDLKNIESLFEK